MNTADIHAALTADLPPRRSVSDLHIELTAPPTRAPKSVTHQAHNYEFGTVTCCLDEDDRVGVEVDGTDVVVRSVERGSITHIYLDVESAEELRQYLVEAIDIARERSAL